MAPTEQVVPARDLRLYDRIYRAGRWRSVISADLKLPPTDDEVKALHQEVWVAEDELTMMEAAFALGYAIKKRRQWPKDVVFVTLGSAGATHYAEFDPHEMVTVRRP